MAAPSRWILPATEFTDCRPVKNAFDPATQPGCRFGLLFPYGHEHLDHEVGVNSRYREFADGGRSVDCECISPLAGKLRALLSRTMGFNVCSCTLIEGHSPGEVGFCGCARRMASMQGVMPFVQDGTAFSSF